VIRLDRIHFDGVSWDFSDYFEYIRGVASAMPEPLREYSNDVNSYALHGTKTLHDSRLLSVALEKTYGEKFSNSVSSIEINFIDQLFEGRTTLQYADVSSYLFKEIDLESNRHADVLVHEFSMVRPGLFRHRIIFDHSGEVEIEFCKFSYVWNEL